MDIKIETERLQKNRLMRNNEEIAEFELALDNFLELDDCENMKYLLKGFDDKTEELGVTWRLVHIIESCRIHKERYYEIFAREVVKILDFASEWVQILHIRILNSPEELNKYAIVVKNLDNDIKNKIFQVMIKIKEEKAEKFSNKVNKFLELQDN